MSYTMAMRTAYLLWGVMCVFWIPTYAYADTVRGIEFPVGGPNYYRDDFGDSRGGGTRKHQGNDIIAPKMTPLVSTIDGKVLFIVSPEPAWGYEVCLIDAEGYLYDYLHMNNDNPGTDDNRGGELHAYAPGIEAGVSVRKGQLIGWVGDSGNAEDTVPHLHFEMRDPSGSVINPYQSLIGATGAYKKSDPKLTITADVRSKLLQTPDGHPDDIFKTFLEQGSKGEEVRQLQIVLKVLGLIKKENITGNFDATTRSGVIAFQKRQQIDPLGIVGPMTRAHLNRGIASGVLTEYKPFYSGAEERAMQIQKLIGQIKILTDRLNAIQGTR